MQNLVPAITFLLAVALRIKHVRILRRDGLAKVLGTVVSIGGATIITLYNGFLLLQSHGTLHVIFSPNKIQSRKWGCIFLLGHCLSWAAWMVLQAPVLKKYPAKLSLTSFTCFFGLVQFLAIAAFTETDPNNWKIQTGGGLFKILYAGIVASGIVISLQTWCIHKGGPVFVAFFQPVQTLLVVIMAALILHDQLYSGGIIGGTLIILGLYLVLWGISEEHRIESNEEEVDQLTKHLLRNQRETETNATNNIP